MVTIALYAVSESSTGFWHEAYFVRGGMEAVYIDIDAPVGFSAFAPVVPARGAMFSARRRMDLAGEPASVAPLSEIELYGSREGQRRPEE